MAGSSNEVAKTYNLNDGEGISCLEFSGLPRQKYATLARGVSFIYASLSRPLEDGDASLDMNRGNLSSSLGN
ncbi:hypothetical protein FRC01_008101, partial [Tulasnella sp. 417]